MDRILSSKTFRFKVLFFPVICHVCKFWRKYTGFLTSSLTFQKFIKNWTNCHTVPECGWHCQICLSVGFFVTKAKTKSLNSKTKGSNFLWTIFCHKNLDSLKCLIVKDTFQYKSVLHFHELLKFRRTYWIIKDLSF